MYFLCISNYISVAIYRIEKICVTISMSKTFENLVLLLAFSQEQSTYLNMFSCINSEFMGTEKIFFTEQKYHQ